MMVFAVLLIVCIFAYSIFWFVPVPPSPDVLVPIASALRGVLPSMWCPHLVGMVQDGKFEDVSYPGVITSYSLQTSTLSSLEALVTVWADNARTLCFMSKAPEQQVYVYLHVVGGTVTNLTIGDRIISLDSRECSFEVRSALGSIVGALLAAERAYLETIEPDTLAHAVYFSDRG
jgi:hypothetical protein